MKNSCYTSASGTAARPHFGSDPPRFKVGLATFVPVCGKLVFQSYNADPPNRGSLTLALPASRCPARRYWILESAASLITKSYQPEERWSGKSADCVAPTPIDRFTL